MSESCIFCFQKYNHDKKVTDLAGIITETEHFYVRANTVGALAPGHIMVISKDHYSCFGALPLNLHREYEETLQATAQRVERHFAAPILVEQGIHGQSIPHAHTHFIPSVSEWYDFSKKYFRTFVPPEIPVGEISGIADICRLFDIEGQYVSIQEQNQLYFCHTRNYANKLRPARDFTAQASGKTELLDWRTMPDSERKKNALWVEETLRTLRGAA